MRYSITLAAVFGTFAHKRIPSIGLCILFFWYVLNSSVVQNMFEHKFIVWTKAINWGVYAFHYPILCTLGGFIINHLAGKGVSLVIAIAMACISTGIITIILACCYEVLVEPVNGKIVSYMKRLI